MKKKEFCCHDGDRLPGYMRPWILLELSQKPCHGYELMEKIAEKEESSDPGLLYRTLRKWETDGILASTWDTEGNGPAKRLYTITPEGLAYLHMWAERIRHIREKLRIFLTEYDSFIAKGETKP